MKKLTTLFISSVLFSGLAFAGNFFSGRILEAKADVPVQFSNNIFSVNDLFFNNGIVKIDFTEIADNLPASGFKMTAAVDPTLGINLNFKKFGIGLNVGVDGYFSAGLGKELFEFLGYGNNLNEDITADADLTLDMFAVAKIPVRVEKNKLGFTFTPSAFVPLVHGSANDATAKVSNGSDGSFIIDVKGNANLYSVIPFTEIYSDGAVVFDQSKISEYLLGVLKNKNFGFDMEGNVSYQYSKALKLNVGYRVPIIPGHLNYVAPATFEMNYKTDLITAASGSSDSIADSMSHSIGNSISCDYVINRPLKLNCQAVFNPFYTDTFILRGMLGFGVRHPFSSVKGDVEFYPEYDFGLRLSLVNILSTEVSTSYMDQVFIHQLGIGLSLRIVEIRAGLSLQAASFASSFQASGAGAYVTACLGF